MYNVYIGTGIGIGHLVRFKYIPVREEEKVEMPVWHDSLDALASKIHSVQLMLL